MLREHQITRSLLKLVAAGLILGGASCQQTKKLDPREQIPGNEPGDEPVVSVPVTYPASHTVIIVGDGFDTINEVYKEQIASTYTLTCDYEKFSRSSFNFDGSDSLLNQSVSRWFRNDYSGCSLSEGLEFNPKLPFEPVLDLKFKWNEALGKKPLAINPAYFDKVKAVLHQENSWRNFAGTALAGLVTYENPEVRIVLVQIDLEMFSDFEKIKPDDCPVAAELTRLTSALADDEVRTSYIEAIPGEMESVLYGLVEKHNATIIVSAFSQPDSAGLNSRLTTGGCSSSDFGLLFNAFNSLDFARLQYRIKNVLTGSRLPFVIAPAGNTINTYDTDAQLRNCSGTEFHQVQIGSYTRDGTIMEQSPRGECIDLYLPGESILVAAPYEFKNVVSGTDISAGLLANYITKNFQSSVSPDQWLEELEKLRDSDKHLAVDEFPPELFLDLAGTPTYILDRLKKPEYLNTAQQPYDFKSLKPLPYVW